MPSSRSRPGRSWGKNHTVVGAIILVIGMLLFFPLIFVIGGVTMGVLGWAAQTEVEDANEGSELIELNQ